MTPTATRPSAASPSDPNEPNPIRTGGVVRRLPSPIPLPAKFSLEPGAFGGIETPLATHGSTVFAAVNGYLYAFNAATGAILLKTPLSSGTNAPVAIHGDYVIAGAGVQVPKSNKQLIIAYILGAKGKFPDTVGS